MNFERMRIRSKDDIPDCWEDNLVVLWQEDDAPVPDKESVDSAFRRMVGKDKKHIHVIDEGDCFIYFYCSGWVKIVSFDGGSVGVLVDEKR